jgi:hypothetical protein
MKPDAALEAAIRGRLELYRRGQPYRSPERRTIPD